MTKNKLTKSEIERKLKLLELEQLKLKVKIAKERNPIYSFIRKCTARYIILIGGAGSGKSYEAADIFIDRTVTETKKRYWQESYIFMRKTKKKPSFRFSV